MIIGILIGILWCVSGNIGLFQKRKQLDGNLEIKAKDIILSGVTGPFMLLMLVTGDFFLKD